MSAAFIVDFLYLFLVANNFAAMIAIWGRGTRAHWFGLGLMVITLLLLVPLMIALFGLLRAIGPDAPTDADYRFGLGFLSLAAGVLVAQVVGIAALLRRAERQEAAHTLPP